MLFFLSFYVLILLFFLSFYVLILLLFLSFYVLILLPSLFQIDCLQDPLSHGCFGLRQVPLPAFPRHQLPLHRTLGDARGGLGGVVLHHPPVEGRVTLHHNRPHWIWLGFHQRDPLRQGKEDIHDRHPTSGKDDRLKWIQITGKAYNFSPHGNFGLCFFGSSIASLDESCLKNEENQICRSKVFLQLLFPSFFCRTRFNGSNPF